MVPSVDEESFDKEKGHLEFIGLDKLSLCIDLGGSKYWRLTCSFHTYISEKKQYRLGLTIGKEITRLSVGVVATRSKKQKEMRIWLPK